MLMVCAIEGYQARLVALEVLRRAPGVPLAVTMFRPGTGGHPALDGVEIRHGSSEDPASLVQAFRGVDRLLLSPVPSSRWDGTCAPLLPVVAAAGEAGVRHIVHRGPTLTTGTEPTPPPTRAQLAAAIERAGATSTMVDTALDPGFLAGEVQNAIEEGELAAPAGAAVVAPLLARDIAVALASVLLEPTPHEGRVYELTGPDTISWTDLADLASARSGRSVAYRPITDEEFAGRLRALGIDERRLPVLVGRYRDLRHGWSGTPTGDFERLAGRPATPARDAVTAALDRTAF